MFRNGDRVYWIDPNFEKHSGSVLTTNLDDQGIHVLVNLDKPFHECDRMWVPVRILKQEDHTRSQ